MDSNILNIEVQEFINNNLNTDVANLLLKGIPFKNIDAKAIIEQIEAKKKCEKKLPTWFNTKDIHYPNKLNIEQTSSESTAKYKSDLVSGNSLIDLTGGFGVDAYYFSKQIKEIIHCETNSGLSDIAQHNFETLRVSNIKCLKENGIEVLKRLDRPFDWIYIDPSRRDDSKNKVFLLSDCTPNVKTFQHLFLKYAKHILIKTSPLLDIKAVLSDLYCVKALHVIAINNDVKELLWILERDFHDDFKITTVNIIKSKLQIFEFYYKSEQEVQAHYKLPKDYIYEPNASVLKTGAFNSISDSLNISKLHKHSHLYTYEKLVDFPGRRFKLLKLVPFGKKALAKEGITKANVTTRNFPLSVRDIRKKLNIKDGGSVYLFFTTNLNEEKIVLICSKIT